MVEANLGSLRTFLGLVAAFAAVAAAPCWSRAETRVSGDQLLVFYDAREGRVPFFGVANPSPESAVTVEMALYADSLSGRLGQTVQTLPPMGNVVVDVTQIAGGAAMGNVGLVVVTAVMGEGDSRPVVPAEPLVGTFTLANVPLESGFGENPVGRTAVVAGGQRAPAGVLVDGDQVSYERLTPSVLMVPVYFNPQQLGPAQDDGNRIVVVAFDDVYGERFDVAPETDTAQASFFDASGTLLTSRTLAVDGVALTDLQTLAGPTTLSSSGKVLLEVDPGAGSIFGLFSQSLGPFGAGHRLPAVDVRPSLPSPAPGPTATPAPPAPTPMPTASPPPMPTASPPPGPTASPPPGPTPSPMPSATPAPTETPAPSPAPTPPPAPTNSPTPAPPVTTYADDVAPILEGTCGGCHISSSQGGFNFAGGRSSLVNVPSNESGLPYITPGSPSGSYLWNKINGTQASVGGFGAQMPLGGSLSGSAIDVIESWILDGALP